MRRRLGTVLLPGLSLAALALLSPTVVASTTSSVGRSLHLAQGALQSGQLGLAASDLRASLRVLPAAQAAVASLRQGHPGQALRQVQALELGVRLGANGRSAGAVRAAVGAVYRSPQLAELRSPVHPSPSLIADLGQLLLGLLTALFHLVAHAVWLGLALAVLLGGGLGGAVMLHRSRSRLPQPETVASVSALPRVEASPEQLFAEAERMQRQGDFREAVRLSFRGLLTSASSRRVLAVDPAWTNADLLRAAGRVADLEPRLQPLVSQFNAVVYGGQDPGAGGCDQFTRACRRTALELP